MIEQLKRQAVSALSYTTEDQDYLLSSRLNGSIHTLAHMVIGDRADAELMFARVDQTADERRPK